MKTSIIFRHFLPFFLPADLGQAGGDGEILAFYLRILNLYV